MTDTILDNDAIRLLTSRGQRAASVSVRPRHPAVCTRDWWRGSLGEDAEVVDSPSTLTRRSAFHDADFVVDNDDVIGTSMTLSERYSASLTVNGSFVKDKSKPRIGGMGLVAPGQPTRIRLEGRGRFLLLGLSVPGLRSSIECDFQIASDRIEFTNHFSQHDPILGRAMLRVATADAENAYEAVLSFIARLLHCHSSTTIPELRRSRSLTPLRLRRVLDQVESDLALPLSLSDLAQTAGVSAFHFAREFRLETGFSPYQYVVRRRIDRAVHLLIESRLAIDDIACVVGFYRAAHMARHMRRVFGLTASELRGVL